MPELPELAIYAEYLRPRVVGKAITAVKVDHSVAFKKIIAEKFVRRVTEHTVWDVVRRGKTLGFSLDSGDRIDVH
jgi:formamidopyrimidine-DNA glycosylase